MSTFQLSEAQTATLQGLFDTAEIAYKNNKAATGIYTDLYDELIEYIRDGDDFYFRC